MQQSCQPLGQLYCSSHTTWLINKASLQPQQQ
jgi:hypothetical protein